MTHSPKGSTIYGVGGSRHEVEARPADELVDTTGAGDAYAGGFLYGWTRGLDVGVDRPVGSVAASHVVAQLGAQPPADLRGQGRGGDPRPVGPPRAHESPGSARDPGLSVCQEAIS